MFTNVDVGIESTQRVIKTEVAVPPPHGSRRVSLVVDDTSTSPPEFAAELFARSPPTMSAGRGC